LGKIQCPITPRIFPKASKFPDPLLSKC